LLTDDHTLFRQGLRTLLAAEPDIEIVGEASNASAAVTSVQELRPDVVLMDVGMPGLSSFEATRQIRKQRPETRVWSTISVCKATLRRASHVWAHSPSASVKS